LGCVEGERKREERTKEQQDTGVEVNPCFVVPVVSEIINNKNNGIKK